MIDIDVLMNEVEQEKLYGTSIVITIWTSSIKQRPG
jgi:hypothetical protein